MKISAATNFRQERALPNGMVVCVHQIATTTHLVYSVLEPSTAWAQGHGTITYRDRVLYGDVGSRRLTPELAALPRGLERLDKVTAFQQAQKAEARLAILQAFPELLDCPGEWQEDGSRIRRFVQAGTEL